MAEIKKTIDMVMERAARIAASNQVEEETNEELVKTGMRLAAEYLNQPTTELGASLAAQPPNQHNDVRLGMVQTLLRNIVLPRDQGLKERSIQAINGAVNLLQETGGAVITTTCAELQQILDQYNQHKEQVTKQLEEALLNQLEQQYAVRGNRPARLTAAMHPKYHEELTRILRDLNGQYTQAMDQRKQKILQHITPS